MSETALSAQVKAMEQELTGARNQLRWRGDEVERLKAENKRLKEKITWLEVALVADEMEEICGLASSNDDSGDVDNTAEELFDDSCVSPCMAYRRAMAKVKNLNHLLRQKSERVKELEGRVERIITKVMHLEATAMQVNTLDEWVDRDCGRLNKIEEHLGLPVGGATQ